MKQLITIALLLCSTWVFGQTVTTPPSGSKGYGTPVATPSGEILVGRSGSYTYVTRKAYTDSLIALGWNKTQIDSAILSQIALIAFPVTSVNGETGAVMLDAADIGLGNVDNTSDSNKPISTATQAAIDGKEDLTNKVTSLTAPDNTTYPTTQAVKNAIDAIDPPNVTGSNGIQVNDGDVSPIYGTSSGTIAQGNDSRINNGQTAFGWGNHTGLYVLYGGLSAINLNSYGTGTQSRTIGWSSPGSSNTPDAQSFGSMVVASTGNIGFQLAHGHSSQTLYFRSWDGTGTYRPWQTLWHSGNLTPPVVFTRSANGLVPAPGGSGTTRYLNENGSWTVPTGGGGGGTATDLSIQNRTSTTLDVGSSTGSAATIPARTASLAGLMTSSDLSMLNSAVQSETDPTVPSHVKSISVGNISSWNAKLSLGDNVSSLTNDANYFVNSAYTSSWDAALDGGRMRYVSTSSGAPTGVSHYGFIAPDASNSGYGTYIAGRNDRFWLRSMEAGSLLSWREIWHSGNFTPTNYVLTSNFTWANLSGKPTAFAPSPHSHNASDINAGTLAIARIPTGTSGSTVALGNHTHTFSSITSKPTTLSGYGITDAVPTGRTVSAGDGLTGGGSLAANRTLAVDGTVVRTSGNQTLAGTKTFSSPVVAPQYQGTTTTAGISIPTNAQSLFTASLSSNTSYTLTNLTGNPRHIQVMVTNTSGSNITVSFNASLPVNQTNTVFASSTAIFTFLINNGAAYGTKTQY